MRTTHKILYVFTLCITFSLVSCNKDLLDKNPPDAVSSAIFWASETDVQSGLAGVYTRLQQNFLGYE
jgi:hypothetical protein